MTSEYDVAVIGGGLVGTSIAYGLAKAGQRVALLDEDDRARRASVANFSLIWVQTKGLGMPEYSDWSRGAADRWPSFSDEIKTLTDIDLAFARPGGFHLCLSDAEVRARASHLAAINAQPAMTPLPYEILGHNAVRAMMPDIGTEVVGASYCPLDGQCNSMRLFWGLHTAFGRVGGHYLSNHRVEALSPRRRRVLGFDLVWRGCRRKGRDCGRQRQPTPGADAGAGCRREASARSSAGHRADEAVPALSNDHGAPSR